MEQQVVIDVARQAIIISTYVAGPMLMVGLVVGLIVSIFQTTTQIQEQTLTFIPKVAAILGVMVWYGPGMIEIMVRYTSNLLGQLHKFVF